MFKFFIILAALFVTHGLIKGIYELVWRASATKLDIEANKVYVKIKEGVITMYVVGASIPRQIRLSGHKCRVTEPDRYYSTGMQVFGVLAQPEVIAIVKLYIDSNGYAEMQLHEFITKMHPANAKTRWLSKL